ncbi:hypothetical protein [Serratia rhizosphaerae]
MNIYYLDKGYTEWQHDYVNGEWSMSNTPINCYAERRSLQFGAGDRCMVSEAYINGRSVNALTPVSFRLAVNSE